MLIRSVLYYIISILIFEQAMNASEKTLSKNEKPFDLATRFAHIISKLEDEKAKNVEKLEEILHNSQDLENRVAASLSLAVFHNRNNPRLSQQYLANAMELKDPFAEDRYLAATAAFFRIRYYHRSQTSDLIRELTTLTENRHLPWKMLKSSFEMLLDYRLMANDFDGYIATFEHYQNRIPRFAIEDQHLKQFCLILKRQNEYTRYARNIESLASRYPLSEEAKWAFQELININQDAKKPELAMTLDFLRNIHLNSIIEPESRSLILTQLDQPLRIAKNSAPRLLTAFEKIRFLLRLNEHDLALKLAEAMTTEDQTTFIRTQGGLWKAHILGDSGRYSDSIEEFKKHIGPNSQVGSFFLESYASNLMRGGQFLKAAKVYQNVRQLNDHYRLRWYTFWNLSKGEKTQDALAVLNSHPHIFFENQQSHDSHLYWSMLQKNAPKKADLAAKAIFKGHTKYYYTSLLRARQEPKKPPSEIKDEDYFQKLSLGFDFDYFIAKQVGVSSQQIAEAHQFQETSRLVASNDVNFSLPTTTLARITVGQAAERGILLPFKDEVTIIAKNLDLDPYLLYALMKAESAFNPVAMSSVGARGIMQIMPYTAIKLASLAGVKDFHLDQLGDPVLSIVYGSLYFKMLHEAFQGNAFLTIAAYNAGPQAVYRWLQGCNTCQVDEFVEYIPFHETRNYVKKVLSYYVEYQVANTGVSPLDRLPLLPDPSAIEIKDLF